MVKLKIKKSDNFDGQTGEPIEKNKPVTSDTINKKAAAVEVLTWLFPLKIACLIGIIFPFISIVLVIIFLEILALIMWGIAAFYLVWILTKLTRYKNYLEAEYGLKRNPPSFRLYK